MKHIAIGTSEDEGLLRQQSFDAKIVVGDALRTLKALPAASFRSCITSPPYWGLRDYGIVDQIGAEDDLAAYIASIRAVFAEVRRAMTGDGTLWLNIGDSYTSGNRTWRDTDKKNPARAMQYRPPTPKGLKPKDLIGVPWRIAFALQDEGWYLRSDIIWNKANCQPESVKDRPTRAHEYIFLFSKSEKYHYDYRAVREPSANGDEPRNRRTVWTLNTEAYKGAHFATFPKKLVEPCVLASSAPNDVILDPFMGSGTLAEVCLSLGRRFIGLEINPEYAALAIERIQQGELFDIAK